ncbi:tyrosine-type recombinase/integrase [Nocardiopsis halophila]|uniref:tyrosine-type recombinase/integrase n=1 Tax=Nocardiopsis halophila TaxID=141692 RepID=UPI00034CA56A|nr:tyrosine-type recombinase/integrase [Nocardiopsis halophila]
MAHVKDLWWKTVKGPDDEPIQVKTARFGKGKRWLAVWHDQYGQEKSKAFKTKDPATRHANAMETDVARGEYIDPKAGDRLFGDFAKSWFNTVTVDPSSEIRYESVYRLHVGPRFDKRKVKAIRPSEIQACLKELEEAFSSSLAATALLVIRGVLELAEADEAIKKNPVKSKIVRQPKWQGRDVKVWSDAQVSDIVSDHPAPLLPMPVIAAGCGMRQAEIFGLALEDLDFRESVIRVNRQIKKLGKDHVFALPKNDKTRTVPMPANVATVLRQHIRQYPPQDYTLPWEKVDGEPHTVRLLFRWPADDQHVRARNYSETIWKPAIAAAGIIPPPATDSRGRKRYETTRREGMHQLRHWYASVQLDAMVSVVALASYLGHDPKVTLSIYGHMLPSADERSRSAIDNRFEGSGLVPDGT